MRRILSILFALALTLSITTPVFAEEPDRDPGPFVKNQPPGQEPPTQQPPFPSRLDAKVVRVIDGDTIEVELNGKKEQVHFLSVDAPETQQGENGVQPCGSEASTFLSNMLPAGTMVKLELDTQERDRSGGILAYVYLNDKSVQKALLAEGLARVTTSLPNTKYIDGYRAVEADAKNLKKGIWADHPCGKKADGKPEDKNHDSAGNQNNNHPGGTVQQPKSGGGGQTGSGPTGGKLPKTATPHPTYAFLGTGIIAAGLGLLLIHRRAA